MNAPVDADDLLTAFRSTLLWALNQHHVPYEQSKKTTDIACREICLYWGGEAHWIPAVDRDGRDAAILEAARNGDSRKVVAHACGVSVRTVIRVVKRQQQLGLGRDEWVL